MENKEAVAEVFNRYAEIYQERYMDQSLYAGGLDCLLESLAGSPPKVLDVACGPGNITQYLLARKPELDVLGIDLAEKMLELARQNNPTAHFLQMDARSIEQLPSRFDGIICGFILPYLSREETIALIHQCSKRLNQNGLLYLSTMEDEYEKSGYKLPSSGQGPAVYQYFHESAYLMEALESNGFDLIFEDRKRYQDSKGSQVTDLILLARKSS